MISYSSVTETPGQKASQEQLSIIKTRYSFALEAIEEGDTVLELACGSGIGLGYLSGKAEKVVGGDIDHELVKISSNTYDNNPKIESVVVDAQDLPFANNTFDVVIIFEAIYYFYNLNAVLKKVSNILKPSGKLLLSSVNPEWHGFNPSPFSRQYFSLDELNELLKNNFAKNEAFLGFEDVPKSSNMMKVVLKKYAVRYGLIPKTMTGKALLKRIFFGKLVQLPRELATQHGELKELVSLNAIRDTNEVINYKQIYTLSTK